MKKETNSSDFSVKLLTPRASSSPSPSLGKMKGAGPALLLCPSSTRSCYYCSGNGPGLQGCEISRGSERRKSLQEYSLSDYSWLHLATDRESCFLWCPYAIKGMVNEGHFPTWPRPSDPTVHVIYIPSCGQRQCRLSH